MAHWTPTFGDGGVIVRPWIQTGYNYIDTALNLDIQPDGQVLAAGGVYASSSVANITLARFEGNLALELPVMVNPAAPTGLSGAAVAGSQASLSVNLSWSDVAATESGYQIEQSPTGVDTWTPVAQADPDSDSFSLIGPFEPNTTYYFRVCATGEFANSSASEPVEVSIPNVPLMPTNLAAQATSTTQVNLTWTDESDNETGFVLSRSTDASSWSVVATPAANAVTYSDTGLSAGEIYYYRITAADSTGQSSYADAQVTTGPAVPSGLTPLVVSNSQISLSWDEAAGTSPLYYRVYQGTTANFTMDADHIIADDVWDNGCGAQLLEAATTYYFRVTAVDLLGRESAATSVVFATTFHTPPATPPTLDSATAISPTQIGLAWTNLINDVTGFQIEESTDNYTFHPVYINPPLSGSASQYVVGGLTDGTKHYFRIRATNDGGGSPYSTQDVWAVTPLARPANFYVTSTGSTQIQLAWDDMSQGELGYEIESYIGSGHTIGTTYYANRDQHSITITGLTASTTYRFDLRTYNAVAFSDVQSGRVGHRSRGP